MNKTKVVIPSLLALSLVFGVAINTNKSGVSLQNDPRIATKGMVAYAASYSSDPTNEPKYSTQNTKTFQYLNLGSTHDYYRGDSVKVGIIDSGINYDHEDFMVNSATKVKGDSKYFEYQTSSWVYFKASQHGYSYIDDSLGHGTNVAATVAAAVNSIGGTGLAPNVELYVYKVTNSSNGYEFGAIQNALMDAQTLGLDVINMSFQSYEHAVTYGSSTMPASSGCSTILSYYLNQAYNAGITLVGAAGNYNTDEPSYPGSNNHVINVGSLNQTATDKAAFSNYGSTIDLVAPGYVHVADKGTNSSYKDTSGTSFSAPLVTAAIALYKQQNPSATPAQIESALYASCDPIDDSGSAYTNWAGNGALNVAKFLGVEESEDGPTEIVINNPEVVNEELYMEVGETLELDWTVNGNGTFDHSVNFYTLSGDNNVVSVDSNGVITAVGAGEDYVVIESNADSNVYASIYVTVTAPVAVKTLSSIAVSNPKISYYVGDTFVKPTVTATYSDSTQADVTNSATFSGYNLSNAGNQTVTVSYTEGGVNKTATYGIEVLSSGGETIEGSQRIVASSTTTYFETGSIYPTGSTTTATASCDAFSITWNKNGSSSSIAYSYSEIRIYGSHSFMITPNTGYTITSVVITANSATYATAVGGSSLTNCSKSVSGSTVTLTPNDGTTTVGFTNTTQSRLNYLVVNYEYEEEEVKNLTSISINTDNVKKEFWVNDAFNYNNLVVTAYYDDESSKTVTPTNVSTPDMTTAGNKTVTVSYTESGNTETQTYSITVKALVLDSITISGYTTSYGKNTAFAFDGTCTAHYTSGGSKVVTPTSVSTPDMTTAGNKTIIVSYTEGGVTRTAEYTITVSDYREVIEEGYSVIGTITYPSNTQTISVNTLSVSTSGYTTIESNSIRLGSGGNTGTVTITSTTSNIRKIVVNAKRYGSDTGVTLTIGGTSNTITSSYADYVKEYSTATNSVAIATTASKKRANIQTITVYTYSSQDIGQSEDCIGLETFISTYMHMDYTDNLGYCKDSEHHYYSTAKTAFNALNTHQRSLFTSNSAYSLEWTRLSTWAAKNGDSLNGSNQLATFNNPNPIVVSTNVKTTTLIVAISIISFLAVGGYFYFRRKRQ